MKKYTYAHYLIRIGIVKPNISKIQIKFLNYKRDYCNPKMSEKARINYQEFLKKKTLKGGEEK